MPFVRLRRYFFYILEKSILKREQDNVCLLAVEQSCVLAELVGKEGIWSNKDFKCSLQCFFCS